MSQVLQAIYENGVLRPLEPLALKELQQVTVTVTYGQGSWPDTAFLKYLEAEADESVTIEQVRAALSGIPGAMTDDFRRERDERY